MARRRTLLGAAGAGLLGGLWSCRAAAEAPGAFHGEWHGVLAAGSARLRLRLVIDAAGARVFSVDQANAEIPASSVEVEGDRIALQFPSVGGSYSGRLENDRLVGEWRQGSAVPLVFTRGEASEATAAAPLTSDGLRALREGCAAPAMMAAALKQGGARVDFVDGLRSAASDVSATTSDRWHLGSITKSMTATLVARCVEAGVVSWDDTVGDVLGAVAPDMRADYRDATFRHLLSHRAGLQGNLGMIEFMRYPRESADSREDRRDFARRALAQEPAGPKEATFLYSNNGYVLAGAMLEQKFGATWESLIADRVFTPLGMRDVGFGAPGTPGALDQPVGHSHGLLRARVPHPPGSPTTDNPAVLGPAGRVHANFDAVAAYLLAHARRDENFLSAESWAVLHNPPFGGEYAMGLIQRADGTLWHNGSNTIWYAEVLIDPARQIVAMAAVNDGRLDAVTGPVGDALLRVAEAVA